MAELLILEFAGAGRSEYDAVNGALGIDPETGEGEWPEGLLSHSAGEGTNGWMVFEVWTSREDQERFMNSRLGAALQQGGVTAPPSRVEWTELAVHRTLAGSS